MKEGYLVALIFVLVSQPSVTLEVIGDIETKETCEKTNDPDTIACEANEEDQQYSAGYKKHKTGLSTVFLGYSIQIVELDEKEGTILFKEENIKKILNQSKLKNKPVMVVSVTGMLRKGKSFFLNLLMKYLSSNRSQKWTHDGETELGGFEWGGGPERITNGIWMWSEIFPIMYKKREVMVILLDTQGTMDFKKSPKHDSSLFALTTAISSIQVYNAISDINEADLRFLELSIKYGQAIKNSTKPFQTLLFLIRDWQYPRTNKYGQVGGAAYLKKVMERESKSRELVDQGFKKRICFLLPYPPHKVVMGESDGRFSDLSGDFLEQIDVLVKMMFSDDNYEVLEINGNPITCGDLFHYLKNYTRKITDEVDLFDITSPAEAAARVHNHNIYLEVMKNCDEELNKMKGSYFKDTDDILMKIKIESIYNFEFKCRILKCDLYDDLFRRLQNEIDMKFQDFNTQLMDKVATARTANQLHKVTASNIFKEDMDKKCNKYIEPENLETIIEETQQRAIQYYEENINPFGPSGQYHLNRLKEAITQMVNDYREKNYNYGELIKKAKQEAHKENEAYNSAKDAFTDNLKKVVKKRLN